MHIYAKYHQTDPKVFYQQEDVWAYADEIDQGKAEPMKPEYLTLNLFQPDRLDFLLLVPMIPKGRNNLRAMAVAGCDDPNYGKLIVYEFPKGELVLSPSSNLCHHQRRTGNRPTVHPLGPGRFPGHPRPGDHPAHRP
jgi:uncharacterized membrane protein (UPF0182 family)